MGKFTTDDVSGAGGARVNYVPNESPFADEAARDVWANANKDKLYNSEAQVTVIEVTAGAITESWGGLDNPATYINSKWIKKSELTAAEVKALYESNPDANNFSDAEKQKLSVIVGIPQGGLAGQILRKRDGTDYAVEWDAPAEDGNAITHVSLVGDTFTFTHSDGAKHSIVIPTSGGSVPSVDGLRAEVQAEENQLQQQGNDIDALKQANGQLDLKVQSLTGGYVYEGPDAPTPPVTPKPVYFYTFSKTPARDLIINTPDVGGLVTGTVLYITNDNNQTSVRVDAVTGQSIENATSYTIDPHSFVMLVLDGANWKVATAGYIPTSLNDMVNRVISQLQIEGKLNAYANKRQGGLKVFATIAERDQYTLAQANKTFLFKSAALVLQNDDSEPQFFQWTGLKVDGTDGDWDQVDFAQLVQGGISLSGGGVDAAGVTKLIIQPNLQFEIDGQDSTTASLFIDPRAYEVQHGASCLVTLDASETIKAQRTTNIYMQQQIVPLGEYYSFNSAAGGINVQDNTGGDTAQTGGELTEVLLSVGFLGQAPTAGNVKVWVEYDNPANVLPTAILQDVNGKPLIVERVYSQGDKLQNVVLAGAFLAAGQGPLVAKVETSFTVGQSVILDPAETLLCLNQFTRGYETSVSRIEFLRRVGRQITPVLENFTSQMQSLSNEVSVQTAGAVVLQPGEGDTVLNSFGLENLTPVSASILGGALNVNATGVIADYYVNTIRDNAQTQMLRGKQWQATVTIKNTDSAFNLAAYAWEGKPDEIQPLYSSRSNGDIVLNSGWSLIQQVFIAENSVGSFADHSLVATVPDAANNVGFFVIPIAEQDPLSLSLKEFTWGSVDAFQGYVELERFNTQEFHLVESESYAEFIMNNQGYQSIRYTIGAAQQTGYPMPIGKFRKGGAPVTIDNGLNIVPGSQDPENDGVLKWSKDGDLSQSVSWLVRNEGAQDAQVEFWAVLYPQGATEGQEQEIAGSRKSFTIKAGTAAPGVTVTVPAFDIVLEAGQSVGYRALSNVSGPYVQSDSASQYLNQTTIDFKALAEAEDLSTFGDALRVVYLTPDINDLKQTLAASDTPETLVFTDVQIQSVHVSVNTGTGEFTFSQTESMVFTVSAQVIRETGGGGNVFWGLFVETSDDGGVTWVPLDGSTRRLTLPSQDVGEVQFIDFTAPIEAEAGLMFRFKHFTSDATKTISVISQAAAGGAPSSAGLLAGFYRAL